MLSEGTVSRLLRNRKKDESRLKKEKETKRRTGFITRHILSGCCSAAYSAFRPALMKPTFYRLFLFPELLFLFRDVFDTRPGRERKEELKFVGLTRSLNCETVFHGARSEKVLGFNPKCHRRKMKKNASPHSDLCKHLFNASFESKDLLFCFYPFVICVKILLKQI